MSDRLEQKYINMACAELYERAMQACARRFNKTTSKRDRMVWEALAMENVRAYNSVLALLAPYGSSEMCKVQKFILDKDMRFTLETISDEEISGIVEKNFGIATEERRARKDKDYEQAVAVIMKYPAVMQRLVNDLHTVGQSIRPLDAKKGGIVKHLIYNKGLPPDIARKVAEDQIEDEIVQQRVRDKEGLAGLSQAEVDAILDSNNQPSNNKTSYEASTTRDAMLDLLTPEPFSETCPIEPDFSEFDSSDSDVVNNSNPPASASNTGADTTATANTATLDSTSTAGNTTPKVIPVKISPPTPSSPQRLSQVKLGQLQAVSEAIVNSGLLDALERRKEK